MSETTETTVVTTSDPEGDPSVLAEAAVASATVAGASLERASHATAEAEEATRSAEDAQGAAYRALDVAVNKISEERAREIAREELAAILSKAETLEEEAETLEVETEAPAVDPQVLPPSVAKANKTDQRKGFLARLADTYHGEGGDEE